AASSITEEDIVEITSVRQCFLRLGTCGWKAAVEQLFEEQTLHHCAAAVSNTIAAGTHVAFCHVLHKKLRTVFICRGVTEHAPRWCKHNSEQRSRCNALLVNVNMVPNYTDGFHSRVHDYIKQ
ncbi:hypothetical protein L9F63_027783, partial [Diploptera punctata]